MMPRRVQDSIAWRHASLRARVVLGVFLYHHDGWNNARLALTIRQIGQAIGDQNNGANGKAVAELIQLGFLDCVTDADHQQSKAREYRITFIPTGHGKTAQPATHEYADWRPGPMQTRKFGGARTATPNTISDAVTASTVKFSDAVTAPRPTENCGFEVPSLDAVTAPLLINQSPTKDCRPARSVLARVQTPSLDLAVPVDELRLWAQSAIAQIGSARRLAQSAGIPEPALSRFRNGKSLPDHFRHALQQACGRALPYVKWKAAA